MRYFEKVFDGQVLKWCVNGAELGGGKPTLLCLVSNETEAESCLSKLEPHCGESQVTALILPGGILPETAVQSLVFEWQTTGIIDKCKLSLTASQSCADAAWQLISHLSHCFSAAAILGGHADPYEVRAAKFMPLKVYTFAGEGNVLADGKVLADAEKLVMSLRVTGSETVERTEINPENAWENVFADGEIVRWLLKQDRRTQLEVTWIKPGFWRIDDYFTATCYLIEGRDKALLIDTGMGEGDLLDTVKKLTRLPVEVAITHPHRDHMFRIDRFEKVYLHKNDVEKIREDENCFAAALSDGGKFPQLVPIDEGSVIDLGGGVTVDVLNLGGHTENSVVFACAHYKALFTGDAIGSGYIVLMICPEKDMYKVLESYKKNLECFLPRAEALRDYAWFGGHSIQENGCDEQHQQDYLAGRSVYYNPLRLEIVQDMVVLCEKLITGEISKADVMSTDEHYCNYGSAGMYFRFI